MPDWTSYDVVNEWRKADTIIPEWSPSLADRAHAVEVIGLRLYVGSNPIEAKHSPRLDQVHVCNVCQDKTVLINDLDGSKISSERVNWRKTVHSVICLPRSWAD